MGQGHIDSVGAGLSLLRVFLPETSTAHFFMQSLLHLNRGKHQGLVVSHEVVELNGVKLHFLGLKLGYFCHGTV